VVVAVVAAVAVVVVVLEVSWNIYLSINGIYLLQ
jgi:hypothetical protein